jgi:1-acyl-sn-glycerol-3-phosphate acyltransferase
MPDAEIIPLGTRGRPGRGSGRAKPSASSRDLWGPRKPGGDGREPGRDDIDGPGDVSGQADAGESAGATDAADLSELERAARALGEGETGAKVERFGETVPGVVLGSQRPAKVGPVPVGELLSVLTGAAERVFGEDAERRLAELLAFLRRRVTGDYVVDDYGLDSEFTERFVMELVRPLATKWFRVEVRGVENLPTDSGALVVGNHSGTVPVDGLMTMFAVHETTGRHLRPLGADLVFKLPFVSELARKAGATLACSEDAHRMLRDGELAAVWPEGFKGIGKPYSERYKLQRFGRGGFVSAAIRTGVPIVPCSIVGAEEIYPLVGNIPSLARLLGVPYIPITPFFPLLGPLGMVPLPSKWIIEFGEPIRTDSYDPGAADDPMLVFNVTDQVRESIQQTLYALLMRRKSVFH